MTITQKKRKFSVGESEEEEKEEYGQKYHCDQCNKDISHMVRIKCAECQDFDLCVECFSQGVEKGEHVKTHAYRVFDILDFSLFSADWSADEELLLVDGLEVFGMGNWEAIAEYIGSKTKTACLDHYIEVYSNSSTFPVPAMNQVFTVRKNHPPAQREKKVERAPASAPLNHEIAGFMPGRREFETEFENDSEQLVKDMEFNPRDSPNDVRLKAYFSPFVENNTCQHYA